MEVPRLDGRQGRSGELWDMGQATDLAVAKGAPQPFLGQDWPPKITRYIQRPPLPRPCVPSSIPPWHPQLTPEGCLCSFVHAQSLPQPQVTAEAKFRDHFPSQRVSSKSRRHLGSNPSSPASWPGDLGQCLLTCPAGRRE